MTKVGQDRQHDGSGTICPVDLSSSLSRLHSVGRVPLMIMPRPLPVLSRMFSFASEVSSSDHLCIYQECGDHGDEQISEHITYLARRVVTVGNGLQ